MKAELIGITGPTAKDLDQVARDTIGAATVAAPMRKLWIEKFPEIPAVERICRKKYANQRLTIGLQKQWARNIARQRKTGQHSLDGTQRSSTPANIHTAARPNWVSLGCLHSETDARCCNRGIDCNIGEYRK